MNNAALKKAESIIKTGAKVAKDGTQVVKKVESGDYTELVEDNRERDVPSTPAMDRRRAEIEAAERMKKAAPTHKH